MQPGVPLTTSSGALPDPYLRMRESDIVPLGDDPRAQLDLQIDCWKKPRWWSQQPTPSAPSPPPLFRVRFTGSFSQIICAHDVLRMIQALLATDPHGFITDISSDRTALSVNLSNFLLNIHGTISGWSQSPMLNRAQ
ncbi:hypothetical protein [Rhizobium sp. RAF56]|uniref:hypothetical protein n=1 Tax=Rhizobium sp. RAF56 TaxID=3233062 RepID=UPI003F96479A